MPFTVGKKTIGIPAHSVLCFKGTTCFNLLHLL